MPLGNNTGFQRKGINDTKDKANNNGNFHQPAGFVGNTGLPTLHQIGKTNTLQSLEYFLGVRQRPTNST